ncbi:hypothetical protein COW99_03845 [Candidatus Roizmanbacteria bacterium CG22_combo_CG10-13_8_21_14_all_38_20]|uniref:tRNA/rRNA methyltransferase SpoU type domain-containing protein n=1 Tax=Candidatus Roizmanbacteria bacterium CG22_combo_CG10-13_8_21_14_all_38_20 TaxID=1974862 RepID=A0A2H0BUP3_9BACT|nr:RNA methyltransferase [Candidatus Microgenomates bacterium]PIP61406.1 MAG: hypothetical protein COW99_03845 [Candidatus Roizmanbacteria bacterium CG22_combo_CG10-13_8_21_14_all_38_20]PJC32323.1 MAG: hypothetical protein CO050_00155 [Candidatus Roizmanbacteria bacterium CG_4_9_14_0_2_um_filter_38_17]
MLRLDAKVLRDKIPTQKEVESIPRRDLFIIVDNVLDTFNTGSMFRLADAVGCRHMYLIGSTDTPDDVKVGHKIHKASVGTHRWVAWSHHKTIKQAVLEIHKINPKTKIVAIEQDKKSTPYTEVDLKEPLALIVGHETRGVGSEGLKLADQIVEIPMHGVNKSLNVLISLAIVCYRSLERK